MKKKKVYISGPITGVPANEFKRAFFRAYDELKAQGLNPMLPPGMVGNEYDLEYDEFMALDLALLELCDAIYLLEGWEKSDGATEELNFAAQHRKEILFENKNERSESDESDSDCILPRASVGSMGLDGGDGPADGKTKEGITRQEASDLQLVGAEIEVEQCSRCAERVDGRICNYGDYYGKMVMEDGRCRGFKGMKKEKIESEVEMPGLDEGIEKMETLSDIMNEFPAQVNISRSENCEFNIYPSQVQSIECGERSDTE